MGYGDNRKSGSSGKEGRRFEKIGGGVGGGGAEDKEEKYRRRRRERRRKGRRRRTRRKSGRLKYENRSQRLGIN